MIARAFSGLLCAFAAGFCAMGIVVQISRGAAGLAVMLTILAALNVWRAIVDMRTATK